MKVDLAAQIGGKGLRGQLLRKRKRAVEMVIQQMNMTGGRPGKAPGLRKIICRLREFTAGEVGHATIEPEPEQHGGGLLRSLLRRGGQEGFWQHIAGTPVAAHWCAQVLHVMALDEQDRLDILEMGFAHKGQPALDAGQHPIEMIAPGEEVDHLVAGGKAGHRHVPVRHGGGKAGFGALDGEGERLGPDAELIQRQQGFGFESVVAVAANQLPRQGAVLETETILGITVANQHPEPRNRRGRRAGNTVIQRQVQHPTQQNEMQARAGKAGEHAGAVEQVHHRFGVTVVHPRQRGKMALRVIADAVAQAVPGLVALGGLRVAADVNAKHRQPAQRRLQRQPVVGLAHIDFRQQVGRQRFFRQPAGGAKNAVAQPTGAVEIAQRELAPGLFAVQREVAGALRQRTGVAQRAGGLNVAQGRQVIPRTPGAAGRQQAQLAEHLALGRRLNAVQRRRDVMHGAEQDLVARRLTGRLCQQAGGGQVQAAALGVIQQGEGRFLHPVVGKGIALVAEGDQLRRHRRVQGIADLRRGHRHDPADHLQLTAPAQAGDAAQQPPGVVRHLLQLL